MGADGVDGVALRSPGLWLEDRRADGTPLPFELHRPFLASNQHSAENATAASDAFGGGATA